MRLTYGDYGGQYVPETLMPALDELAAGWEAALADDGFRASSTSSRPRTPAARRRSRGPSASRPGSGSG